MARFCRGEASCQGNRIEACDLSESSTVQEGPPGQLFFQDLCDCVAASRISVIVWRLVQDLCDCSAAFHDLCDSVAVFRDLCDCVAAFSGSL